MPSEPILQLEDLDGKPMIQLTEDIQNPIKSRLRLYNLSRHLGVGQLPQAVDDGYKTYPMKSATVEGVAYAKLLVKMCKDLMKYTGQLCVVIKAYEASWYATSYKKHGRFALQQEKQTCWEFYDPTDDTTFRNHMRTITDNLYKLLSISRTRHELLVADKKKLQKAVGVYGQIADICRLHLNGEALQSFWAKYEPGLKKIGERSWKSIYGWENGLSFTNKELDKNSYLNLLTLIHNARRSEHVNRDQKEQLDIVEEVLFALPRLQRELRKIMEIDA